MKRIRRQHCFRPRLERLEDRCVLSATLDRDILTVGVNNPSQSWEAELALAPNPAYNPNAGTPSDGAADNLTDVTLLRVEPGASYDGRPAGVLVSIHSTPATPASANFDVYIYQSDELGNRHGLVASARNWQDLPEATAVLQASGYYLVQVVYTDLPAADGSGSELGQTEGAGVGASAPLFVGKARFVAPSDWSPRVGVEALGLRIRKSLSPTSPYFVGNNVPFENSFDFVGLIDSFDGLTLSTNLYVPTTATTAQPLPTMLIQGGFPPGNRSGGTLDVPDAAQPTLGFGIYNFLAAGYASVSFSLRGVEGSCGPLGANHPALPGTLLVDGVLGGWTTSADVETPRGPGGDVTCAEGYSHWVDRNYETKDAQHLLGVLVDYGIAHPDQLGMAGESWGGGQTWLLATSLPWDTPAAGERKIQLAAAMPYIGWTDFLTAFLPNGRATDAVDQSASHARPFGVVKSNAPAGVALGEVGLRLNHTKPTELHSYSDGWLAFFEAGEPYDSSALTVPDPSRPGETVTITAADIARAFRTKSAYYADDYFAAVAAGAIKKPVSIFAIQGWPDALFPPVEALQIYRKFLAADPNYPIWLTFGDLGHENAQKPAPLMEEVLRFDPTVNNSSQAKEFFDYFLRGIGQPRSDRVVSYEVEYVYPDEVEYVNPEFIGSFKPKGLSPSVRGADWDGLTQGVVRLTKGADDTRTTVSGPPNVEEELLTYPRTPRGDSISGRGPIIQPAGTYDDRADWTWEVPSDGFTLLGLPRFTVNYDLLVGDHAMIAAKLWDVDPDDNRILVTRGVYRLSEAGGDSNSGTLSFQLFGNHYKFQPGHRITLELSQTDVPYFQPDGVESGILFSSPELALPTVEPPNMRVSDVTGFEGDSGMTAFTFTLSLSWEGKQPVTVSYATADGTARHGTDYLPLDDGVLTFAPGETAKTITVRVKGDTTHEQDETLFVNLANSVGATLKDGQGVGTILNDDGRPRMSVSDMHVQEGNLDLIALVFTVTLSHASEEAITVNFATADGTGRAGSDYEATSGTLVFQPGETTKTITVWTLGDLFHEEDEFFYLDLSSAVGALLEKRRGLGTILNDDL